MQKILIAEDVKPLLLRQESPIIRADIQVFTVTTNDDLLRTHIEENVNLIVSRPDLSGAGAEEVFTIIRQGRTLRKVSIVLICEDNALQQAVCRRCGANTVLTLPVDPVQLQEKARQYLAIAARQAYRVVLNVAVDGKFRNQQFLCRSENISATGVLIRADLDLVAGEGISCSFYLPEGTKITSHGEVVRIAQQSAEMKEKLYGVRFTNISRGAQALIDAYVKKKDEEHRCSTALDQRPLFNS